MSKLKNIPKFDTHHHMIPDFYVEALKKIGITEPEAKGIKFPKWTPQKTLNIMKQYNIEKSYLSITLPGVYFSVGNKSDKNFSRNLARRCNEYGIKLKKEYPEKLGVLASLPLPDVKGSLLEAKYAIEQLGVDGFCLLSNVEGNYLGNKSYDEVFAYLNENNSIIFLHPKTPIGKPDSLINTFYWWFLDTTYSILDFIKSGYHKKYPNLRFILAHAGGVLPVVFERVISELEKENVEIRGEATRFLKRIYADTAKSVHKDTLDALYAFLDKENIVFGSDYIFANKKKVGYWLSGLEHLQSMNISLSDFFKGNTVRLFSGKEGKSISSALEKDSLKHDHIAPDFLREYLDENTIYKSPDEISSSTYLALYAPKLWDIDISQRRKLLKQYNTYITENFERSKSCTIFAAVDMTDISFAQTNLSACMNDKRIHAVALYVTSEQMLTYDEPVLGLISNAQKPIMLHPVSSMAANTNTLGLDSAYYISECFYKGVGDLLPKGLIVAHSSRVPNFLKDNIGSLYYLREDKMYVAKLVWDHMIIKKPRGILKIESFSYDD